jgi:hypothetical protein
VGIEAKAEAACGNHPNNLAGWTKRGEKSSDQDIGICHHLHRWRAFRATRISALISLDESLSVPTLTDCRCIFFTAATTRLLGDFIACLRVPFV